MNTGALERLDTAIQDLTLVEQVWLMERLAHSIQASLSHQQQVFESELDVMAADPEIQREISLIHDEFAS